MRQSVSESYMLRDRDISPRETRFLNNCPHAVEEVSVPWRFPAELIVDQLDLNSLLGRGDQGGLRSSSSKARDEALGLSIDCTANRINTSPNAKRSSGSSSIEGSMNSDLQYFLPVINFC